MRYYRLIRNIVYACACGVLAVSLLKNLEQSNENQRLRKSFDETLKSENYFRQRTLDLCTEHDDLKKKIEEYDTGYSKLERELYESEQWNSLLKMAYDNSTKKADERQMKIAELELRFNNPRTESRNLMK